MVAFATAAAFASKAAPFVSSLGSLAGGLGIGGKKKRGPSLSDQSKEAVLHNYRRWDGIMNIAKQHKLHPLAVAGNAGSGFSPSFEVGRSSGADLEQLGQGVDRAINAGRNGIERKIDEERLRNVRLQNDALEIQVAGAQSAITNTAAVPALDNSKSGRSSDAGGSGGLNDFLKSVRSDKIGIDDGLYPRHKIMVDQNGDPARVLNTDQVGDNDWLMLLDLLTSTVPDLGRNYVRRHLKKSKKYMGYRGNRKY